RVQMAEEAVGVHNVPGRARLPGAHVRDDRRNSLLAGELDGSLAQVETQHVTALLDQVALDERVAAAEAQNAAARARLELRLDEGADPLPVRCAVGSRRDRVAVGLALLPDLVEVSPAVPRLEVEADDRVGRLRL